MSSVLIRNGLVVDGTGRAAFPADVLVEGDRIADILPRPASPVSPGCPVSPASPDPKPLSQIPAIDATGCLVTPGFIDAHAHRRGGWGRPLRALLGPQGSASSGRGGGVRTTGHACTTFPLNLAFLPL